MERRLDELVVRVDGGRVRLREPRKGRTKKGRKKFAANWREPRLSIIYAAVGQPINSGIGLP